MTKKAKPPRKLRVNKQSKRRLTDAEAGRVAGGDPTKAVCKIDDSLAICGPMTRIGGVTAYC